MMGDKEMDAVDAAKVGIKEILPKWDEGVLEEVAIAAVEGFIGMYREPIAIARWARKNGVTREDLAELVRINVEAKPERSEAKKDIVGLMAASKFIGATLQRIAERHDIDYDDIDADLDDWDYEL